MDPIQPEGEFHHFQLVSPNGEIPFSVSILVHYNQPKGVTKSPLPPLTVNDVLELHEALDRFDGDFAKAFAKK
jgi:hypothetical protein